MPVIAVVGASAHRGKFGNKALRAYRKQGFTVVAVNPNAETVEGAEAYPSVLDYPGPIDEATVYVPPDQGLQVIGEIARKQIRVVWLNPGADSPEVVAKARQLGLDTRVACSIRGVGESPGDY